MSYAWYPSSSFILTSIINENIHGDINLEFSQIPMRLKEIKKSNNIVESSFSYLNIGNVLL